MSREILFAFFKLMGFFESILLKTRQQAPKWSCFAKLQVTKLGLNDSISLPQERNLKLVNRESPDKHELVNLPDRKQPAPKGR